MLFKESGYDEFLKQKIQKGFNELEQGKYITAEQFKQEMELLLANKERELQQFENNIVYG